MKPEVEHKIREHFAKFPDGILRPREVTDILRENRKGWGVSHLGVNRLLEFLVNDAIVTELQLTSSRYAHITRYVKGKVSSYALALSLRPESYLSHGTALELHGLAEPSTIVYANREQSPKDPPEEITQANIRRAFKSKQRRSNYIFHQADFQFVLLTGKHSGRAGVIPIRLANGENVDCTDLERTLIDIVVRPAYAGGIERVASVYAAAAQRIDVLKLRSILDQLEFAYPYEQAIGFLLERAGCPRKELKPLSDRLSEFDFYLDYGMTEQAYDVTWQLHYPAALGVNE